jgi:hypothetical protein
MDRKRKSDRSLEENADFKNARIRGSAVLMDRLILPTKSTAELTEDAGSIAEGAIAYSANLQSVQLYRGPSLRWGDIETDISSLNDWVDNRALTLRASTATNALEYLLAEAYSGPKALADAQGPTAHSPHSPTLTDPQNPSMLYLTSLIEYVYSVAAGESATSPDGLTYVSDFSIWLDPVPKIAVLWKSTSNPSIGYLAFRGTMQAFEWAVDAAYHQVAYEFATPPVATTPAYVHGGFYDAYLNVASAIRTAIASSGITKLFITGHSLGGALAALATADLSGMSTSGSAVATTISTTTFAAPRTGNQTWAAQFESQRTTIAPNYIQVVADGDLVPATPLAFMVNPFDPLGESLSFQHVGTPVLFRSAQRSIAAYHSLSCYSAFAATQ